MSAKFSREDRLYILARALTDKELTPKSNLYASFIRGVSAANFSRTKEQSAEDAETLTLAYGKDQWNAILGATETTVEPEETPSNHDEETLTKEPPLFALKSLNHKPSEPVKTIQPKHTTEEAEYTEQTIAYQLYKLAQSDMFDGSGRIMLAEARNVLGDKSLSIKDILELWQKHYPAIHAEQRAGNIIKIYFQQRPRTQPIIIPQHPALTFTDNEDGIIDEPEIEEEE
jgi:hypothetical protein